MLCEKWWDYHIPPLFFPSKFHERVIHWQKIAVIFPSYSPCQVPGGGGEALVFKVGYHPGKIIHVIRVVFQDQAVYACTSFRGAKTCKIWKKWCVFGHSDKFWKGHDGQIEKNTCKNAYLGSIFIPEKYVFRVCFESPFTRMISSLKYNWLPSWVKLCLYVVLPDFIKPSWYRWYQYSYFNFPSLTTISLNF